MKKKRNLPKKLEIVWLSMLLIFPFVLWILPSDFFVEGHVLCPSRFFFDIECLGCGMTRAVMHLHHFELEDAIFYNSGVVLAYPFLVLLWGYWTYKSYQRVKANKQKA